MDALIAQQTWLPCKACPCLLHSSLQPKPKTMLEISCSAYSSRCMSDCDDPQVCYHRGPRSQQELYLACEVVDWEGMCN